jgi:uncharacterized ferritin-like protein (DUF455 family)
MTGMFRFAEQNGARAKNIKILSGLHRSNYWWDFNQNLQENQTHHLLCTSQARSASLHKMAPRAKKKNLVQPSQVKLLVGFQPNFTGVIGTIHSCAHHTLC